MLRIPVPSGCLLVLALGASALTVACSVSPPGASPSEGPTTVHNPGAGDAGDATAPTPEAGDAAATPTAFGSPLCPGSEAGAGLMPCDPDSPALASLCLLAPDGGPYSSTGGYADASLACRVYPSASASTNGIGSARVCAVAGSGTDGTPCTSGGDCAAGFDCVDPGVCRHYCCAGDGPCAQLPSYYCDIQPMVHASTTRIPVCMPIEPAGGCSLLGQLGPNLACPSGQTCGIVREDGSTGCIDTGNAKDGDPCETQHCGAGLVCLGTPGARQCFSLCNTSKSNCTAPETCQGGLPLFQDPLVGVCRP